MYREMRKKLFRILIFAALFCIVLTVSVFAEEAEVTGNDVNFRSGPGTDYAIYDCLPRGTVVTVTDRSDSEWYSVTYDGNSGFIYAVYLSVYTAPAEASAPAAAPAPAAESAQSGGSSGSVNAMYVRLRSGPSTDHSILGEYNSGTALTVTGSSGDWYAVVINGQSGYMYAQYVTVGGEASGSTASSAPAPASVPAPVAAPVISVPDVVDTGNISGYIQGDYVYLRSGPSSYYAIYSILDNGTPLTITGRADDWYAVTVNGQSGYVYSSYVASSGGTVPAASAPEAQPVETSSSVEGYICGNDVRFRSGPSTRHDILGEYNYGTALTITGTSGEWKAVVINGVSGYVYGQYVETGHVTQVADDPSGGSVLGQQIVDFAMQYLGYNYTWGGTSPSTGFDCSGFTTYVYGHFGIELNRVACDQANNGVRVDPSALQPGDLLCFYSSSDYIGHVGIYIGNNRFIHSSTYTTGVIISELSGYYDTRGFVARRVI